MHAALGYRQIMVRLCRTHDSGLLCINISEGLSVGKQPRLITGFRIPSPHVPTHKAASIASPQPAQEAHESHDMKQQSSQSQSWYCSWHASSPEDRSGDALMQKPPRTRTVGL